MPAAFTANICYTNIYQVQITATYDMDKVVFRHDVKIINIFLNCTQIITNTSL